MIDTELSTALDVARDLARAGVPVFVATPDPESTTGFRLPPNWQRTIPDPSTVDTWRPGMALCAVMGHGLDLLDVDPRSGGIDSVRSMNGSTPHSYGMSTTPSGGYHSFIAPLWVGSRDGVYPGVDIKGGMPDGSSRGFAFLPPTVRRSKVDGVARPYRYTHIPQVPRGADGTGERIAEQIRTLRIGSGMHPADVLRGPEWWVRFMTNKGPHSFESAEQAITAKLDELREHGRASGFRTALLRASLTLGGYVGARPDLFDEADMRERLESVAGEVWDGADEDDRKWIEQGLTDGQARPFHVYTAEDAAEHGAQDYDPDVIPVAQLPTILDGPFDPHWCSTDQEFADAILAYLRPILRYATDARAWIQRDGDSWTLREDLAPWAVAHVVQFMPPGVTPVPQKTEDRQPAHWQAWRRAEFASTRRSSAVAAKIRALVAGGHPSAVRLADLDADPLVLWAGRMPFDLRTGAPSSTVDLGTPHLRTAAVVPDRNVSTPVWDRFISTVWPDPAIRAYALRVLSVALTGYPDAVLPVLHGDTRTGKTSVAELIVDLLGLESNGYAGPIDPDLLSNARAGGTKAHVFELKGQRFVYLDESLPAGRLAAERLKQYTGGGAITADPKYGKPVRFKPTHTLAITANDPPSISDPAVRARVRLLPCDGDPAAVRAARAALADVWHAERPGVLAALMAHTRAYLADRGSGGARPRSRRAHGRYSGPGRRSGRRRGVAGRAHRAGRPRHPDADPARRLRGMAERSAGAPEHGAPVGRGVRPGSRPARRRTARAHRPQAGARMGARSVRAICAARPAVDCADGDRGRPAAELTGASVHLCRMCAAVCARHNRRSEYLFHGLAQMAQIDIEENERVR